MTKTLEFLCEFIESIDRTDQWSGYILPDGTRLNRRAIAIACSISRSALYQNTGAKELLDDVENKLRHIGLMQSVMKSDQPDIRDTASPEDLVARLTSLTSQVSQLESKLSDLYSEFENLESKLQSIPGY